MVGARAVVQAERHGCGRVSFGLVHFFEEGGLLEGVGWFGVWEFGEGVVLVEEFGEVLFHEVHF